MTPERWQRIETLYHSALEQEPAQRFAFLAQACGGDRELRREVESLLAQPVSREGPLDRPALDAGTERAQTQLAIGSHLGPYKISGSLGAGGMGQVYKARDTRLGRDVAIKILSVGFSDRFEREARAVAALNHPHICTLHDVGPNYLVMELVEGETLADRLDKGALPMGLVLEYGMQIADALAAAHAKRITHRDLKPGNIMLTKSGVKVLDFGLAKIDGLPGETLTASHIVMGTPAYMAPEQKQGKECDGRADIFALGLVLCEMATGKRAASGQIPNLDHLPRQLAHVIERCLELDVDERWQSARDVGKELQWVAAAPTNAPDRPKLSPWLWAWGAGLLGLGFALSWAVMHLRAPIPDARSLRLDLTSHAAAEFHIESGASISPDGLTVTFVARSGGGDKLWVRRLDSKSSQELTGTEGATFPFWSPDSRSIGFFAGGKLKRVDVTGGSPSVICDVPSGRGGTWNRDGEILFNAVNDGPLLRVSKDGGTPVAATAVDAAHKENSHRWPYFLPDGRHFLYFVRGATETTGTYLGSLDRPQEKTKISFTPTNAVYARGRAGNPDHLLWVSDGNLLAQAFDQRKARLIAEPIKLAEGVGWGPASRLGAVSVSDNGNLLYASSGMARNQLTWNDREGRPLGTLGQPGEYKALRISPDGKRVVLVKNGTIWQIEFGRGVEAQVSSVGGLAAIWSFDSKRIVYTNSAPPNLFVQQVDSASPPERLTTSRDTQLPVDWSLDGKYLLFSANSNEPTSKNRFDLWILPMSGDRKPFPFLETPFRERRSQFSPDGKWIAYESDESGHDEVYVESFPNRGAKWQVSSNGGDYIRWRRDGKEIFYVAPDKKLMSVSVHAQAASLSFGAPSALFSIDVLPTEEGIPVYTYDAMPDGEKFLKLTPAGQQDPSMTIMTNWLAAIGANKQ